MSNSWRTLEDGTRRRISRIAPASVDEWQVGSREERTGRRQPEVVAP
jgi:hypothetical protein